MYCIRDLNTIDADSLKRASSKGSVVEKVQEEAGTEYMTVGALR
jgi:hypothetical protein